MDEKKAKDMTEKLAKLKESGFRLG